MVRLLLTCEHGGNWVPPAYSHLFEGQERLLNSHEGYDIGALALFHDLDELASISFHNETTRLLVEMNRSSNHKNLFSAVTKALPEQEKKLILREHYYPYRDKVEHLVHDFVMAGRRVLHIAVHTFTPELNGEVRQADIGLLYDPKRKGEQAICKSIKQVLQDLDPGYIVRYNYPYLGISDGFATYLRRKFSDDQYIGIELEVNQRFPIADQAAWVHLRQLLKKAIKKVVEQNRAPEEPEAEA